MTVKRNLYPKGTPGDPLKSNCKTGVSPEIDLRSEFDDLVFGGPTSIAHGRLLVLRRMRRGSDNKPLPCVCRDSITDEPDTEDSCPYCLGEGYYWDEEEITGRSMYLGADGGNANRFRDVMPGSVRADMRVFFFRYDTVISYRDKIVDLKLDPEGDAVVPYIRESIYKPQTIMRHRSDNGRSEYIAVYCKEDDAIRVDE